MLNSVEMLYIISPVINPYITTMIFSHGMALMYLNGFLCLKGVLNIRLRRN